MASGCCGEDALGGVEWMLDGKVVVGELDHREFRELDGGVRAGAVGAGLDAVVHAVAVPTAGRLETQGR